MVNTKAQDAAIKRQEEGTALMYKLMSEASQYDDVVLMGRGDPDFDTPEHVIQAARDAMLHRANEKTPPEGLLALREAIAARHKVWNGIDVDPETEVCVTNGGVEALRLMLLTTIGAGDGLLFPEPNYNSYRDSLRYAGGVLQPVLTEAKDGFRMHPERVEAAITDATKAMLLISPGNPNANVITPEDMRAMVDIAERHDLLILSDEIYDTFIFDDFKHVSPAALPGGKARTLTLNALSKAFAMTGWRLGWIVGPADLMARFKSLKEALSGGSSVVKQYAALAALTGPQDATAHMHKVLTRRRRMMLDKLDAMGIPYGIPHGGQFLFMDISITGMSDVDLSFKLLRDQKVLTIPGSCFGSPNEDYIRLAFLTDYERLEEGMDRIKVVIDEVMGRS
jgi:aminotransferase